MLYVWMHDHLVRDIRLDFFVDNVTCYHDMPSWSLTLAVLQSSILLGLRHVQHVGYAWRNSVQLPLLEVAMHWSIGNCTERAAQLGERVLLLHIPGFWACTRLSGGLERMEFGRSVGAGGFLEPTLTTG